MKVTSGKNAGGRTVSPAVPPTIPSAHVTENSSEVIMADAYVSPEWKFDTGSSAHMTDDIDQFE